MNYHDRIMRIQCDPEGDYGFKEENSLAFREGHRDARHEAAEIVLEAENMIEEMLKANQALRGLIAETGNVELQKRARKWKIEKPEDI